MSVGAVYDRALFLETTKYARSQTAPTGDSSLLGQALFRGGVREWLVIPRKNQERFQRQYTKLSITNIGITERYFGTLRRRRF
jgi:hypothetical protein